MASTVHLVCLFLFAAQLAPSNAAIWPFSMWFKPTIDSPQYANWDPISMSSDTSVLFVQPDQSGQSQSGGNLQQVQQQNSQVPRQDTFYQQITQQIPVKPTQYGRRVRPTSGINPSSQLVYSQQESPYGSPQWVYVTPVDEINSPNQPLIVESNNYQDQQYPGYNTGPKPDGTKGGTKHPQAPVKQPPVKRPWWIPSRVINRPRPIPTNYNYPYSPYPYHYPYYYPHYPISPVTRQPSVPPTPTPPVKKPEQNPSSPVLAPEHWPMVPSDSNIVPQTVKPDSPPVIANRDGHVNVTQSTDVPSHQPNYFHPANPYIYTPPVSQVDSVSNGTDIASQYNNNNNAPQQHITKYLSSSDFNVHTNIPSSNTNINLRG